MFLGYARDTCEVVSATDDNAVTLTWTTYMLICTSSKLPLDVRLCRNMIHSTSQWILHQSLHELLMLANTNPTSSTATRCARHLTCGNHTHQELMHLLAAGPNVTETRTGFEVVFMHDIDSVSQFSVAFSANKRQPRITPSSDQTSASPPMHTHLAHIVSGTTVMFRATVDIGVTRQTVNFCLKQQVKNK